MKFDDNEKIRCLNIKFDYAERFQFYQKAFPFCSQWKFTKDMYQCVGGECHKRVDPMATGIQESEFRILLDGNVACRIGFG